MPVPYKPEFTYQAMLSLLSLETIGRSGFPLRVCTRSRTHLRRHEPEYLVGPRPPVILPLTCLLPNISLESLWYVLMHSSTLIPNLPSIMAIRPPVLVPATRSKTS